MAGPTYRHARWGGLNLQDDEYAIAHWEARDAQNIFLEGSHWRVRGGIRTHTSSAIANNAVTGLYRYYPQNKPPWTIAAAGDRLLRVEDDLSDFSQPGSVIPKYDTGTVTSDGTTTLEFSGTQLTRNVLVGDKILLTGDATAYTIASITDADTLVVDANVGVLSAVTYKIFEDWSNGDFRFETFQDNLIVASQGDIPRVFDGRQMVDLGYRKGNLPTIAAGAAGLLDGQYRYAISYLYVNGEGNIGEPTAGLTVGNKRITVTVPIGEQRVTGRKIWRGKFDPATSTWGDLELVESILDNSATSYSDNIRDTATQSDDFFVANDAPPETRFLVNVVNRMFYAKDSDIFYSKWGEPDNVPDENRIQISTDDGEKITGILHFAGALWAWKETSLWKIPVFQGIFSAINVVNGIGCIAPRSLTKIPGGCVFAGRDGIYVFDGIVPREISRDIRPMWDGDYSDTRWISPHYQRVMAGTFYRNRWILMAYPSGSAQINDKVLVADIRTVQPSTGKANWVIWTNVDAAIFNVWDGAKDTGELYFGHASNGKLFQLDTLTTDSGVDITAFWQGGFWDMGNQNSTKRYHKHWLDYETKAGAITRSWGIDHDSDRPDSDANSPAATVVWDDSLLWGPTAQGGSGLDWVDPTDFNNDFLFPQEAQGKRIQYKLQYVGAEECEIRTLALEYQEGEPRSY